MSATRRTGSPVFPASLALILSAAVLAGRASVVAQSGGGEWANLSAGSEEKGLRTVAVDPLNPQRVFIGSAKGVFLSAEAGKAWVNCLDLSASKRSIPPSLGIPQKTAIEGFMVGPDTREISGATTLAIDPANPSKIFAGSVDGLYLSNDGGKKWAKADGALKNFPVFILDIAIDPSNPDVVYSGTLDNALIKSSDGGATWQQVEVAAGERSVTAVRVHPFDSNVLYAGTTGAVYKTKDGGASWDKVFSKDKAAQSLAIDGVNPEVVYLASSAGLYKSADGGVTWMEIGTDLIGQKRVKSIAVAPSDSKAVYAVTSDGVYGSPDGGTKWQDLSQGTGLKDPMALAFDPLNSATIWAAAAGGLYRTAPAGAAASEPAAVPAPSETVASPPPPPPSAPSPEAKPAGEMKAEATGPVEETVETVQVAEAPPDAEPAEKAVPTPPVPTIDDVQTILGQFQHEPSVQEVQEVAMRFAEVHPDIIEGWRKGAKYKALLPKFKLGLEYNRETKGEDETEHEIQRVTESAMTTDVTDTVNNSPLTGLVFDTETELKTVEANGRKVTTSVKLKDMLDRERNMEFVFEWELGDFLFNPDQVRISDESRDLVELRNDVLEEVTQFYFQRRQLQIDLLLSPAEELRERLRLELQLQEVTANIDYLTGGYLTSRLNDVKTGKVRSSNIMKRLFPL